MSEENEQRLLSADTTLNDIAAAIVDAAARNDPLNNPIFESVAILTDGRMMRVSFIAEYKWITELPEVVRQELAQELAQEQAKQP